MPESRRNAIGGAELAEEGAGFWPTKSAWQTFYLSSLGLITEWIVVYGGANWITGLHRHRVELQAKLDSAIPFIPAAAIVYLSLFPMLWLSPFVLRSAVRLRVFARALAVVIAISGVGFLLVPAEPVDAYSAGAHAVGGVYRFAEWINLTHNYFPSLHVGMAVVCAVCYSRTASRKATIVYWLWAAMIAIATLLTRQHYVADVIAGGALGAVVAGRLSADAPST